MKKGCKLILGLTESKTKRKAWHFSSVSEKHAIINDYHGSISQ